MNECKHLGQKHQEAKIYVPRDKWYNTIILPFGAGEQKENKKAKHKGNR